MWPFLSSRPRNARRSRTVLQVNPLEDRSLPAIVLPTPGIAGGVFLTGTDAADSYVVRLSPGNAANIQFSDNGGSTFSTAALADVTGVFVQGADGPGSATIPSRRGSDQLTIDQSNGLVAKPGGLTIDFVGGKGKDYLNLSGNGGAGVSEVYTQTANSTSDGAVQIQNVSASLTVTFHEVARIRDSMTAASFTFNPAAGDNFIALEKGKSLAGQNSLRIEGVDFQGNGDELELLYTEDSDNAVASRSAISFVPIDLNQKTAIAINAGPGNDFVVLDNKQSIPGLATLTLDGGAGTNRLYRDDVPSGVTVTATNFTTVLDAASAETFVTRLYIDRLKRVPNDAEVAGWKAALPALGETGVTNSIDRSPEAYNRQVEDWYTRYLGRGSDDAGRANWVNQIAGTVPEESALSNIVGSGEYYANAQTRFASGTANQRYVQALYLDFLNRSPDDSGYAGWTNALQQSSPSSVAYGFLASLEFRGRFVEALYSETLSRDSDPAGFSGWVSSTLDDSSLRRGFRGSSEYYDDSHASSSTSTSFDTAGNAVIQGTSANKDDKKYYDFIAPRNGVLTVQVTFVSGSGDLELEDQFGNSLFETDPNNGINSGSVAITGGIHYFVRMRSSNGSPFNFQVNLALS